jgi:cytochrome c peroxidase
MFAPNIFWDGRATSTFTDPISMTPAIAQGGALESQSVGPPLGSAEMACDARTWDEVLNRLRNVTPLGIAKTVPPAMKSAITSANGTYQQLFATAFGDATPNDASISVVRFAFAIATHERHLTSNQTPWDKYNAYLRGDAGGDANALTAAQKHGLDLFLNKAACATCHVPPLFTDAQFHNLGFIALSTANGAKPDLGRSALAGHTSEPPGQVKTPSLRNVGLRAHEGLFHYGFGPGADLKTLVQTYNNPPAFQDPTLADPTASVIEALNLTADEIDDLVDFLQNGLTDPRVESQAFPFDRPTLSTE